MGAMGSILKTVPGIMSRYTPKLLRIGGQELTETGAKTAVKNASGRMATEGAEQLTKTAANASGGGGIKGFLKLMAASSVLDMALSGFGPVGTAMGFVLSTMVSGVKADSAKSWLNNAAIYFGSGFVFNKLLGGKKSAEAAGQTLNGVGPEAMPQGAPGAYPMANPSATTQPLTTIPGTGSAANILGADGKVDMNLVKHTWAQQDAKIAELMQPMGGNYMQTLNTINQHVAQAATPFAGVAPQAYASYGGFVPNQFSAVG
ncbi:MAG: hypothetical protein VKJ06_00405 [Vampirovibrionales bacterium]|nr:hypothetical protein [Vampirovibrionales bacterium]